MSVRVSGALSEDKPTTGNKCSVYRLPTKDHPFGPTVPGSAIASLKEQVDMK